MAVKPPPTAKVVDDDAAYLVRAGAADLNEDEVRAFIPTAFGRVLTGALRPYRQPRNEAAKCCWLGSAFWLCWRSLERG